MASKPFAWAVLGARGTGKSAWVKQQLGKLKPRRLVVWDYMREYSDGTTDLAATIRAMGARSFSVVFQPSHDDTITDICGRKISVRAWQFELFCKAAFEARNLVAIVEELAFVTRPSWAPAPWRELSLLGRHQGVSTIGTSQRPASIDKDFLGNVDLVHCGRLALPRDAANVAPVLGIAATELLHMPNLAFIERREGEHKCTRGVLSFSGAKRAAPRALGTRP
jgi:hypothetical protein